MREIIERFILVWKCVAIFLLIIVLMIAAIRFFPTAGIDFTQFDTELWAEYPRQRHKMIEDFERKYPIEELTKENVLELLGDNNSYYMNSLNYYVGRLSLLGDYYAIIFDEDGQCIDRHVYSD